MSETTTPLVSGEHCLCCGEPDMRGGALCDTCDEAGCAAECVHCGREKPDESRWMAERAGRMAEPRDRAAIEAALHELLLAIADPVGETTSDSLAWSLRNIALPAMRTARDVLAGLLGMRVERCQACRGGETDDDSETCGVCTGAGARLVEVDRG